MAKRKPYVEPVNYIPENLRKKYKVGEYNEEGKKKAEEFFNKEKVNRAFRDIANGKK